MCCMRILIYLLNFEKKIENALLTYSPNPEICSYFRKHVRSP